MAGSGIPRAQDELTARDTSARQKYSRLIVGREGLGALIGYELVQLLSQWVPGALGLALRKVLYPTILGACGRGVVFGQNVVVAVRITDHAEPGEIVVSGLTRDLTVSGGDLSFGPAAEVELKGLSEPWRIHRVTWSHAPA